MMAGLVAAARSTTEMPLSVITKALAPSEENWTDEGLNPTDRSTACSLPIARRSTVISWKLCLGSIFPLDLLTSK